MVLVMTDVRTQAVNYVGTVDDMVLETSILLSVEDHRAHRMRVNLTVTLWLGPRGGGGAHKQKSVGLEATLPPFGSRPNSGAVHDPSGNYGDEGSPGGCPSGYAKGKFQEDEEPVTYESDSVPPARVIVRD